MRLFLSAIILAGCFIGVAALGFIQLQLWSERPHTVEQPAVIEFKRGTNLVELSEKLSEAGVIKHPKLFQLWVRALSDYSKFQAGTYRFSGRIAPQDIVNTIRGGDIHVEVAFELVIPEGSSSAQIGAKLEHAGIGTRDEFIELTRDKVLMLELGVAGESLEGYLFPATYRFAEIPDQRRVLEEVLQTFWRRLPADYPARAAIRGLTLDRAVIFASLIELETPHDDERPKVAEVIWRRLLDNTPLAIDAALIYGIKDYKGDITREHLKDQSNRYNSRIHSGLPPTAIGSPSLASLEAVLNPTNEGYYFYVLDVDNNGRHHFSKTIAEHNKYVEKLKRRKL